MSMLHWGDNARLKTYSSSTKAGGRSVIKVEIETDDTFELGHALRQLAEITGAQKATDRANAAQSRAAAAAARAPRRGGKATANELPPYEQTLLLEDRRGRDG